MYRSGALKFSNGATDSNVVAGLSLLSELTGNNQCSSHQALGDLVHAKPLGFGCAVGHHTAFSCGSGGQAQNSCCAWHHETTYSGVKQRLFECLQSMWDEGITPGIKGHWETMRSTSYTHASCGCGGSCAGCSEPVVEPCRDKENPRGWTSTGQSISCDMAAQWGWCRAVYWWILEDCPLTC